MGGVVQRGAHTGKKWDKNTQLFSIRALCFGGLPLGLHWPHADARLLQSQDRSLSNRKKASGDRWLCALCV